MKRKKYIVSYDTKSGMWYAHREDLAYVPVSGSFSEKKPEAMEYAKMYNYLPNKVEQIEEAKKAKWKKEMEMTAHLTEC